MASPVANCRRILITGPPGVGKTTLVRRVRDELAKNDVTAIGFYTEEVRDKVTRERIGFDVLSFPDGTQAAAMARVSHDATQGAGRGGGGGGGQRRPTVGKYSVDTAAFEGIALASLSAAGSGPVGKTVVIIDEIGKMELFCRPFVARVRQLFGLAGGEAAAASSGGGGGGQGGRGTPHPLLATVPSVLRGGSGGSVSLVEELKSLPGVQVITISKENRLQMAADVAQQLRAMLVSTARSS